MKTFRVTYGDRTTAIFRTYTSAEAVGQARLEAAEMLLRGKAARVVRIVEVAPPLLSRECGP